MPSTYKTPGVYIEEISKFPPSVAQVETAIPAFIGYTQKAVVRGRDLHAAGAAIEAIRITSLLEYEQFFGKAEDETGIVATVDTDSGLVTAAFGENQTPSDHNMYYSLQAYFANGGGPGYIVSVGKTSSPTVIEKAAIDSGIDAIEKEDEVTLIVVPESLALLGADDSLSDEANYADFKDVYDRALKQCVKLQDRFVVMDAKLDIPDSVFNAADFFRSNGTITGTENLKYGASYGPRLETIFDYVYKEEDVNVIIGDAGPVPMNTINPENTSGNETASIIL